VWSCSRPSRSLSSSPSPSVSSSADTESTGRPGALVR
jgi:hypothetical protein